MQIAPAARVLLVTGTAAPGSLVWRRTRGDKVPGALRLSRCRRGRSSAEQRFWRANATPGEVRHTAPNETLHSQKHYGAVNKVNASKSYFWCCPRCDVLKQRAQAPETRRKGMTPTYHQSKANSEKSPASMHARSHSTPNVRGHQADRHISVGNKQTGAR